MSSAILPALAASPRLGVSSLSDLGLIYCDGGKSVLCMDARMARAQGGAGAAHFSDPLVDIELALTSYAPQKIEKLFSISYSPRNDHLSPTGC